MNLLISKLNMGGFPCGYLYSLLNESYFSLTVVVLVLPIKPNKLKFNADENADWRILFIRLKNHQKYF